jgi:hypothetical protein
MSLFFWVIYIYIYIYIAPIKVQQDQYFNQITMYIESTYWNIKEKKNLLDLSLIYCLQLTTNIHIFIFVGSKIDN